MNAIVPSYLSKVTRAKKHLVELDEAIKAFAAPEPYGVLERMEGKKKPRLVRRVTLTADPANTDIPIIAADVIYNLRSALDHLMASLVANSDKRRAMFPIYFAGVWEAPLPGENEQRLKERSRWARDTKTIKSDAVAILKSLQPPDTGGEETETAILDLINRLSNRDRHEKLPVIAAGLEDLRVRYREPTGRVREGFADPELGTVFEDKATISCPDDAMNVEIAGKPVVAIRASHNERYVALPTKLDLAASFIETRVIAPLLPYGRSA